ncbi:unnamed protein product [Sphagnum troendelagicum]
MGWSYRKATTAAQNLPKDWQEQGDTLKHHLANIVDREGIPPELLAARATAKATGASSSTAAAAVSIQDVAAQATAAEEYLQIDEQLALQSEVL